MSRPSSFLIVEDSDSVGRGLQRLFARHRPSRLVQTVAAARDVIESSSKLAALIVDIGLPDGSGLDVLASARARWPDLPALVLTARVQPELINRSFALRGEYLCKPGTVEDLLGFIRRAIDRDQPPEARVRDAIEALRVERKLTVRDVEILEHVMREVSRQELPERLGQSPNTTKLRVRMLLRRAGATSLDGLRQALLRRIIEAGQLGGSMPPAGSGVRAASLARSTTG